VGKSSLGRTHFEVRQMQANMASCRATSWPRRAALTAKRTPETDLAQKKKARPEDVGYNDAIGPSGRNRKNIPSESQLGLYPYTAAYSV